MAPYVVDGQRVGVEEMERSDRAISKKLSKMRANASQSGDQD
jgi:hypothetical protein